MALLRSENMPIVLSQPEITLVGWLTQRKQAQPKSTWSMSSPWALLSAWFLCREDSLAVAGQLTYFGKMPFLPGVNIAVLCLDLFFKIACLFYNKNSAAVLRESNGESDAWNVSLGSSLLEPTPSRMLAITMGSLSRVFPASDWRITKTNVHFSVPV